MSERLSRMFLTRWRDGTGLVERVGATTYITVAGAVSTTVTDTSLIASAMDDTDA
jgi:hypothetical protein